MKEQRLLEWIAICQGSLSLNWDAPGICVVTNFVERIC